MIGGAVISVDPLKTVYCKTRVFRFEKPKTKVLKCTNVVMS
jgi:hypothetical protein